MPSDRKDSLALSRFIQEMQNHQLSTPALIVLRNMRSCEDCFHVLDQELNKMSVIERSFALSFSEEGVLNKKRQLSYLQKLMPDVKPLILYKDTMNLLYPNWIDHITPEVILVGDTTYTILSYHDIFSPGSVLIQSDFRKKVNAFFHQ